MERLNQVAEFATELIKEHVPHYSFQYTNGKRTLGYCKYGSCVIGLSKYHALHSADDEVINTVLHEIAHALVGRGHGHNHVWKAMCRKIGARPERCSTVAGDFGHKFEFRCATCVASYPRHRKPKYTTGYLCGKCRSRLTFHEVGGD